MHTLKAKVAAAGATVTAIMACLATAQVILDDGAIDFTEYGSIAAAVATLAGTVYGVWAVPNAPVERTRGPIGS